MSTFVTASVLALVLGVPAGAADVESEISGSYLEARTADIYTGPCFANSEVNLEGKEAVLAWQIDRGSWHGVDLEGQNVVAVLKSRSTLGDPFIVPEPRSVVVVDRSASEEQRLALVALVREMAPGLLDRIVAVQAEVVEMEVGEHGAGWVRAGDLVMVTARPLNEGDHLCGNEEIYYPPLSRGVDAHPGVTLRHEFNGRALGSTWKSPGKRSSFAGRFSFGSAAPRSEEVERTTLFSTARRSGSTTARSRF